jgi:mannose-6-phosphate isomerase
VKPIRLGPNQPRRFYRGGERIARFRGLPEPDDHVPEDWVGATNPVAGSATDGLAALPDGRLLRDAVAAEPEAFLGEAHVRRFGGDPGLLVKLLDAGDRLPVHSHPDDVFAQQRLGRPRGKTEAWLILEGGTIHLGWKDDVDPETVIGWVERQDGDAMLAALNERRVSPGDCVYVPATVPHSLGEGVFMVEVQQPSDLGVLLEWQRFGLDPQDAHMGLGWEDALGAVRLTAVAADEIDSWTIRRADASSLVPPDAEPFFRAQRVRGGETLEPAYSILVVVEGDGRLGDLALKRGDTILVPFAAGPLAVDGDLEAIRCLPPDVAA